ncbi:MAG: LysM peptidoglycan-binding domain-containing protein [Gammaproteobacteria bacterium]|nr:LysM peptidoglycan-binding domain-containing protein [Gammaproteobacteria bacterium]
MKLTNIFKNLGILVLVVGLAVGCSTGPSKDELAAKQAAEQAIASAQSAIEEASALGAEWRDSQKILDEAKAAFEKADYVTAKDLANKAEAQARNAIAQLKTAEQDKAAGTATGASNGNSGASNAYTVKKGDSLWAISGKSSTYGNPYQWPLIYKANKDSIKDADLIEKGQKLNINSAPSAAEVDAAVMHAKTRGAWSVGPAEASDSSYLAK